MKYLLGTILSDGKELYASFKADSLSEAKRRMYLRLSQKDVDCVTLWRQPGADWQWVDYAAFVEEE